MAKTNTILKLSYESEKFDFFNSVVKSLIELMDKKGAPDPVGQMLKNNDASIEVFNGQIEQFVPINTVFKRKEVKLPLWIK